MLVMTLVITRKLLQSDVYKKAYQISYVYNFLMSSIFLFKNKKVLFE